MTNTKFNDLNDKMKAYADWIRRPEWLLKCTTEQLTRQSLIELFLDDVLGFERDPLYVEREYLIPSGKEKGKKIDYVIKIKNKVRIVIEAKQRGSILEQNSTVAQVKDYGNHAPSVKMIALTNGIEWHWFKKGNSDFEKVPFLTHDVLDPTEIELPFLNQLRKKNIGAAIKTISSTTETNSMWQKSDKLIDTYDRRKNQIVIQTGKKKTKSLKKKGQPCAWKGASNKYWKIEDSATNLMINVLKYLAKQHKGGESKFFEKAEIYLGTGICKKDRRNDIRYFEELNSDYVLYNWSGNAWKRDFLLKAERLVVRKKPESPSSSLVDFWFNIGKRKKQDDSTTQNE